MSQDPGAASRSSATLKSIADTVLNHRLHSEPLVALQQGRPVTGLPALSLAALETDAAFYASCSSQLALIDATALAPLERAFLSAMNFDLNQRVAAVPHRLVDFVITPYRGGDLHTEARAALDACDRDSAEGRAQHASLCTEYARLVDDMIDRTVEQRAAGILLARPAIPVARATLDELIASSAEPIRPGLKRLRNVLDDTYENRAPAEVGLHRYRDGEAAYRALIAARAETDATPEAVHAIGLESIARLEAAKNDLRARVAGGTTRTEFEQRVLTGREWLASSPQDVESRYATYLSKLEPELPKWFSRLPRAPWGTARADSTVEAGMSFGYYERPTASQPMGRYRYNGSRLSERSMIGAQHLIYHELMPGHHLQLSLQSEAAGVHPLQAHLQSMAAVEGWAVYASELAREMGLYDDLALYGHYAMQSFLAARLVVDTGLNALGWSFERARAFLRAHTIENGTTIESELLRYATDIPAQALAYDLGRRAIEATRCRAAQRLQSRFDVRAFHDTALEVGGYPLRVLEEHIDAWVSTV